jgi:hypothetical protein
MQTTALHSNPTASRIGLLAGFPFYCLIAGQGLMCLSSFFWAADGRYSINASVMIIISMVFWAAGLPAVFALFTEKHPWYARLGLLYAMYGCFGGAAFGFEGLYSALDGSNKIGMEAYTSIPMQMNLVLFWPGPAFPLSMLILGIFLIYRKLANPITGALIILGAIAFPLSRIARITWIAHVADLVLLLGVIMLAIGAMSNYSARGVK